MKSLLVIAREAVDILGFKVLLAILQTTNGESGSGMDIHSGCLSELYLGVSACKTN